MGGGTPMGVSRLYESLYMTLVHNKNHTSDLDFETPMYRLMKYLMCTLCVQFMCTVYVYTLCVHYVYTLCVHFMCTLYVYTLCVHFMCTLTFLRNLKQTFIKGQFWFLKIISGRKKSKEGCSLVIAHIGVQYNSPRCTYKSYYRPP